MTSTVVALWRGAWSLLHPRMLALTVLPLAASALIWIVLTAWAGPDWLSSIAAWLVVSSVSQAFSAIAHALGLGGWFPRLDVAIATLLLTLLLLPVVLLTVLVIVGATVTPAAVRHVGRTAYPQLEVRGADSFLGSSWNALVASMIFAALWVISLPLWLIPGAALILPPALWAWLNYRVIGFDALARYATPDERRSILRERRGSMWLLGLAVAVLGVVPTSIGVAGLAALMLAPILAVVSVWLYVCLFVFASLAFAHLCLSALAERRRIGEGV